MNDKTLIIGDTHLEDRPKGLLKAQVKAILHIAMAGKRRGCKNLIFLGDLTMHRKPKPSVLLALRDLIEGLSKHFEIFILRGNHDSETKADDGVTHLSLLDDYATVIEHTTEVGNWLFIPHYEREETIKAALANANPNQIVFGHFGFRGALNSAGDNDFGLELSDFNNPTILGHIHKHTTKGNVTVLGTPYTTGFGENSKDCWYGILDGHDLQLIPSEVGPKHIIMEYNDLPNNIDWLNSLNEPSDFVQLRININTSDGSQDEVATRIRELTVPYVDIKYKPLLDENDEFQVEGDRIVTDLLDEEILDHYINSSSSRFSKQDLLDGLKIINENQRSRNS